MSIKKAAMLNINEGYWGFFGFPSWNSNFTVRFWWRSWPWTQKISLPSYKKRRRHHAKYIFERIYVFYLIILCPRNCEWRQKRMWCLQYHSGLFHKGKANQEILQNLIKYFHINCCLMWAKSKMRLIFGKALTPLKFKITFVQMFCVHSLALGLHIQSLILFDEPTGGKAYPNLEALQSTITANAGNETIDLKTLAPETAISLYQVSVTWTSTSANHVQHAEINLFISFKFDSFSPLCLPLRATQVRPEVAAAAAEEEEEAEAAVQRVATEPGTRTTRSPPSPRQTTRSPLFFTWWSTTPRATSATHCRTMGSSTRTPTRSCPRSWCPTCWRRTATSSPAKCPRWVAKRRRRGQKAEPQTLSVPKKHRRTWGQVTNPPFFFLINTELDGIEKINTTIKFIIKACENRAKHVKQPLFFLFFKSDF